MANDFYFGVVQSIGFAPDDEVLVVCGGPYDVRALLCRNGKDIEVNLDYIRQNYDASKYKSN